MTGTEDPLVVVEGLVLAAGDRRILDDVGFTLTAGSSVGLVGASGSGKTTTALATLGYLRPGIRHIAGTVRVQGAHALPDPPPGLRGVLVGFLSQDPGQSLNPYRRIGAGLLDLAGPPGPGRADRAARADLVSRSLLRVGLPGDPDFARRFPHQLSGGQQQRVALAMALSRNPALLVLDEPTTGLDVRSRTEVVAELRRVNETGVALLWISHDLGVLRAAVDRVLVMDAGRLVEDRPTEVLLRRPSSAAATRLVAASSVSAPPARRAAGAHAPLLRAHGLTARHGRTPVLHGVELEVHAGELVAVLGVSGAGKTTLGRCLAGLHRPASGRIEFDGAALAAEARRRTRAQRAGLQFVAQDPAEALHPRQTVRDALVRPMLMLRGLRRAQLDAEVDRLLSVVHIPGFADRLPRELSGGERQRVALARALAAGPQVLVCDEVTSALDLVTQAAVLDLLAGMRRELGLAVLLITHDLTVAATADRRVELADGRIGDGPGSDPPVHVSPPATGAQASPADARR